MIDYLLSDEVLPCPDEHPRVECHEGLGGRDLLQPPWCHQTHVLPPGLELGAEAVLDGLDLVAEAAAAEAAAESAAATAAE